MKQTTSQKVALITGSAKGLGRAMAEHLAFLGYQIIIHYNKSEEEAVDLQEELQKEYQIKPGIFKADLCVFEEVKTLFKYIDDNFNRLDILINNIGDYLKKNILETEVEEWDKIIQSNLGSTFYCSKLAIEMMQKSQWGRIINIGFASLGNIKAETLITPYFIGKTGVLILTKSLAKELAKENITVNMLSPGVLENSISQPVSDIPKGRPASFLEFNDAVEFLLSKNADYITGVNLEVAGGWRL